MFVAVRPPSFCILLHPHAYMGLSILILHNYRQPVANLRHPNSFTLLLLTRIGQVVVYRPTLSGDLGTLWTGDADRLSQFEHTHQVRLAASYPDKDQW